MPVGEEKEVIETDVLIIGGGGAGAWAAIKAGACNVDVLLVTDALFGKGGLTITGMGGLNAALGNVDPEDNWEAHFKDTVVGGSFLNNQELVEVLTREAPQQTLELERYGACFDRTDDGRILQRIESGATYHRTCMAGDRTGHEMMKTLTNEVLRQEVEVLDEVFISNLILQDGKVVGATGIDMRTGEFLLFKAKATILATGGAGRVYRVTSNSLQSTGDGQAMAFRIGAELVEMEQYQFHPTGMVYPESVRGVLVSEGVRGDGGQLFNTKGERFMRRYDPERMELSTRDVVSRAIVTEIREGRGTEHGGVYLDIFHVPAGRIEHRLPTILSQFLRAGVDIRKEPMEVAPPAHFCVGGIKTDVNAATTILGLYAAGEVAGGIHGGNRLGANSFPELLVFGERAGQHAARYAKKVNKVKIHRNTVMQEYERVLAPIERKNGANPINVHKKIQKIMEGKVGLFRDAGGLKYAISELAVIREMELPMLYVRSVKGYNYGWIHALKIWNMVDFCDMVARSALTREESRGCHYRTDFPSRNDEKWLKNIVIKNEGGELKIITRPIVMTRLKP